MGAIRRRLALRTRVTRWLSTYRPGGAPDIAIFGLRRGGSTLLADVLSTERGIWKVDEPFFLLEVSPEFAMKRRWLRPPRFGTFFDPDEDERREWHAYMASLLAGRIPLGGCPRPKFPLHADRILLKVLHATAMLDWMAESFDLQVVRLLRHPASQALSVVRAGWDFGTEAFYLNPDYLLGFLDEEQVEAGRRILAGSSRWQMAILDWCIYYHILVRVARHPSPLVTYEELMLDPGPTCRALCEWLGLSDIERITARVKKPSTSPGGCSTDSLSLIQSGDSRSLIRSWQRRVDASMIAQAQEILDRFEVSIYNMSSPLPDLRGAGIAADRSGLAMVPG